MAIIDARPDREICLAELRRRIGVIERGGFGAKPAGRLDQAMMDRSSTDLWEVLGVEVMDRVRSGEDRTGPAFHELVADGYGSRPAVRDFGLALVASLLHRQANAASMVLWCQRQKDDAEFGRLYGPGLADLGLSPERLIMVTGRRDADCLWAMEQGLRSGSLAAIVGMVGEASMVASRRLSLAASDHRTCCLLLPLRHGRVPSAASARWRVGADSSAPDRLDEMLPGRPRWQLTLDRCRYGRRGHWTVEWDHAAHHFHLAAPMGNRPVATCNSGNKEGSGVIAFDRTG